MGTYINSVDEIETLLNIELENNKPTLNIGGGYE